MSNIDAQVRASAFDVAPTLSLPPALAALLAHLPGSACAAVLAISGADLPLPLLILVISAGAALLAWYWRLPIWWRYINLFFLPLIGLALHLQTRGDGVDPNWFLAAFLLLALTSIGAVRTRVPLYLSSPRAAEELALRLPIQGSLIDLGCGLGGPLARVRKQRPDAHLAGIEAAPLNWLIAKLRLRLGGGRADIRLGSLWNADLSAYDIVYAYLSPAPMARLWDKARAEMKPGSLLISNTFAMPDFDADEVVDISKPGAKPGDLSHARLLIWRM
ncbi:MAG: class I SAM-dependent methyltransferase [Pseudomonadota bacterium]|nr:class I SAM-dependent methyltransferase [Pseudomonadota bacterium]